MARLRQRLDGQASIRIQLAPRDQLDAVMSTYGYEHYQELTSASLSGDVILGLAKDTRRRVQVPLISVAEVQVPSRRRSMLIGTGIGALGGLVGGLLLASKIDEDDKAVGNTTRPASELAGVVGGFTGGFALLGFVGGSLTTAWVPIYKR